TYVFYLFLFLEIHKVSSQSSGERPWSLTKRLTSLGHAQESQREYDQAMRHPGFVFQLLAPRMVQGPCSQEVPNAIDEARSSMREAKLGRQKACVMRSDK